MDISSCFNKLSLYLYIILDVDECETETDNCHDSATCTDTDGGFDCSCKLGFTGNGINCSGTGFLFPIRALFIQAC